MDDREMKRVIFSVSLIAALVGLSACESHDWDNEVKGKLYPSHDEGHGKHGEHDSKNE